MPEEIKPWTIANWAEAGCPSDEKVMLVRPSAEKWPNTFVRMWKGVTLNKKKYQYLCLDLHYEGDEIESGRNLQALGSLWVKGMEGALHPEQVTAVKDALEGHYPKKSPNPARLKKFGKYD